MQKKYKRALLPLIIYLAVIFTLAFVFAVFGTKNTIMRETKETAKPITTTKTEAEVKSEPVKTLPVSYINAVPYTVQAPYANWNIHEESCEEAALLMVHYYLAGSKLTLIPQATANTELIALRNWQIKSWGKEMDLNLTQLGNLARDYYGYRFEVKKNITATDIKKAIFGGNPVLVPVITHGLQNPHYGPNPTYHILLIKGYDATGVITNDAGVKEGRNYHYTWQVLWQAIDAQTAKMRQGRDMLIVTK